MPHSVEFFGAAGVDGRDRLAALAQLFLALLTEMAFEQQGVAGVGFERGVGNVADERHQSDEKVEDDVEHHLELDRIREASLDLAAGLEDHEGHECVQRIANPVRARQ